MLEQKIWFLRVGRSYKWINGKERAVYHKVFFSEGSFIKVFGGVFILLFRFSEGSLFLFLTPANDTCDLQGRYWCIATQCLPSATLLMLHVFDVATLLCLIHLKKGSNQSMGGFGTTIPESRQCSKKLFWSAPETQSHGLIQSIPSTSKSNCSKRFYVKANQTRPDHLKCQMSDEL